MPVCANKVLLEHNNTHLFTYCLKLLSSMRVELGGCNTDCMAHRTQNIYSLALVRVSLLTPDL